MKKIITTMLLSALMNSVFAQEAAPKQGKPNEKTEVNEANRLRRSLEEKQLDAAPVKLRVGNIAKGNDKQCTRKRNYCSSHAKKVKKSV